MKKMTIEQLLSWAFREELPKVGAGTVALPGFSPTDVLAGLMELGTGIDKSPNGFGVISGYVFEGDPHPDAVLVGNAVKAIGQGEGIEIAEGWRPFPEWDDPHGLIAEAVERVRIRQTGHNGRASARGVASLVINCALLNRAPDWQADEPETRMITRNGKPAWFVKRERTDEFGKVMAVVEEDGFDGRKQRPKPGAYRKYRLMENIEGAILDRMEWQLWQSALATLHGMLSGHLAGHELWPFRPVYHPWARLREAEEDEEILNQAS